MQTHYHLAHGPYLPPTLSETAQLTCLYRKRLVRVTRWSDSALPWPLGIDAETGGRPSPIVDQELARAIRLERPRTLCHWWGVSMALVQRWRKAFGVKGTTNCRRRPLRSLWERPSGSRTHRMRRGRDSGPTTQGASAG